MVSDPGDSQAQDPAANDGSNQTAESSWPRSPRPVEVAFALGWHIAELLHMQADEPETHQPVGLLPQVRNLPFEGRLKLLCEQITIEGGRIPMEGEAKLPSFDAKEILKDLQKPQAPSSGRPSRGATRGKAAPGAANAGSPAPGPLDFLRPRHVDALTLLTALSFEIGKAYSLGVTLGETTSTAYQAAKAGDAAALAQWPQLFAESRIGGLAGQVRDMKSQFAPYVVDPVASTLLDWGVWVRHSAAAQILEREKVDPSYWHQIAQADFYPQAQIWRALLSGEKLPTDMLKVGDYIGALQHMVSTYLQIARGLITRNTVLVAAGGAGLVLLLVGITAITNAQSAPITALLGFLSVFGVSGATLTAAVRKALAQAEERVWDSEIAAAVANAIDRVPGQLPTSHVSALRAATSVRSRPALPEPIQLSRDGTQFWDGSQWQPVQPPPPTGPPAAPPGNTGPATTS